ncbi:MAG: ABC transporter permease [Rubrivivax sp.]|nr:ABC transporter permease [Rubrivivax sp.]
MAQSLGRRYATLVGRRLVQVLPVLVLATFVVFALVQLIPGDLAVTLAGEGVSEQRIQEIRQQHGLDQPLPVQYGRWLWQAAQGDLSTSLLSREPVATSIARRLPNTLLIVSLALLISMAAGIPLGIVAATRPGSRLDGFVTTLGSLGIALPGFWLAMILVAVLSMKLQWFPVSGAKPFGTEPLRALHHAFLPALALAASGVAEVARQARSALLEVMGSQYVRTLHAKGLPLSSVFWKHGLKNVSVVLLTVFGLTVNRMLGATVVIEAVFAVPGMGSLIVNAATGKDFPVVQGVMLTMVLIVIGLNLLIDMLYVVLDPRVSR